MYTVPFTTPWYFDRCHELGMLAFISPILLLGVTFLYIFFLYTFKSKILFKVLSVFIIGDILVFIVSLIGTVYLFFGGFGCEYFIGFWPQQFEAPRLNASIKEYNHQHGTYPQSKEALSSLFPEIYTDVSKNNKINYVYDGSTNTYTLFVRPSLHYVTVFHPTLDSKVYSLDMFASTDNDGFGTYPPDFPGPWDQLPK